MLALNSREALEAEMRSIGAGREGIRIMLDKGIFRVVRLYEVPIRAALIIKQEMLSKGGEAALPLRAADLAVESCDILMIGTERQFREVIATLKRQPFGLPAIASEIESVLEKLDSPLPSVTVGGRTFTFGQRTYIMGVLNVTPDSFSDGGRYQDPAVAVRHALSMLENGADIIDVGGESSRPGAESVSSEEEFARVAPAVEALTSETHAVVSVDTYKAEVARRCLDLGAHMINDITALAGEGDMASVISRYGVPVVLMHMKGRPRDMQINPHYDSVVHEIHEFLDQRIKYAQEQGIPPCNIIIDPGIGFGKTPEHNLEILARLAEFRSLGRPILVGTSRKSTIGKVLGLPVSERLFGTAATVACAIASGADIVRVHDVREMARVARMTDAIVRGWQEKGDDNAV
ncbi:MAG: dihydropteroate synthase [Firmicutes bacterium]|nr:dihydropteroate synthase [Bacillota bacterium]